MQLAAHKRQATAGGCRQAAKRHFQHNYIFNIFYLPVFKLNSINHILRAAFAGMKNNRIRCRTDNLHATAINGRQNNFRHSLIHSCNPLAYSQQIIAQSKMPYGLIIQEIHYQPQINTCQANKQYSKNNHRTAIPPQELP
ncbi:hypothetical protein [Vogesella sp. LIG4]|uniref:hypothetical protein n=1 Tax=Vogesella sp. LIG4 TaxID=1192162 RepID=UPI0012FDDF3B|nr:hypothetical protein [Vogesella sp. LIG4]